MYGVLRDEPPEAWLRAGEVWTKYLLIVSAQVGPYGALVQPAGAASGAEARQQAFDAFLETVRLIVYDLETGQQADERDFVNKNFGAD